MDKNVKINETYKKVFDNFGYFNFYSNVNKLMALPNPHLFYEEIDKKEQKKKNIINKNEEIKEEKEKLAKKRGMSVHNKAIVKTKIYNKDSNRVKSTRKYIFEFDDEKHL